LQEYLKQADVCSYLNIGRRKYYQLIKLPAFPAVRIGRCVRVSKAGLEKWVSAQKNI
jgi:excisionase family DNA binding protein